MGEISVKAAISNPFAQDGAQVIDSIVDNGATYTIVPSSLLTKLGIEKKSSINIQLGDGRIIQRFRGSVKIEIQGVEDIIPVLFGEKDDPALLGVTALEIFGFTIDPIDQKLVPKDYFHHY